MKILSLALGTVFSVSLFIGSNETAKNVYAANSDIEFTITNGDQFTDAYDGASGSYSFTPSGFSFSYTNVRTKSGATKPAYNNSFITFLDPGSLYSTTTINDYYIASVTVELDSSSAKSGQIGIDFSESVIDAKVNSLSAIGDTQRTFTFLNSDKTKKYFIFSTSKAQVKATAISIVFKPSSAVTHSLTINYGDYSDNLFLDEGSTYTLSDPDSSHIKRGYEFKCWTIIMTSTNH